ncbi:MAG: hypothetical protein A2057_10560 [Ignavibacteria bacterium GWA2_35_9]|nr:MAG: hypothetical protein A2057_10560 [Ignavibacteria bacterium GWA2_35_9]OGU53403.1 MAG: hypothetical protein A2080_01375 [Ignavibacteria bacterium GWC2_36_12]
MRYIYFDETEFGNDSQFIGYGALVCEPEVSKFVILEAMKNLIHDLDIKSPKTKKLDDETILRGYFHASEDSKNAHSYLCGSLSKNIKGLYRADIFAKNQNNKKSGKRLDLASTLCSMKGLNTREEIVAIFEQRDNLKLEHLKLSFDRLHEVLFKSCYDYPLIPAFFPKINFKIVDKNEPGVQCIDFLLWATQRKYLGKDGWYNRIKSRNGYEFENNRQEWKSVHLELNTNFKDAISFYRLGDYDREIDNIINNEILTQILFNAIKVISYCYLNNLPSSLSYIREDLNYLYKNKINEEANGYIQKLAKVFLILFDTLPLIESSTSQKEKEFLIASKKYLALTLHKSLIHSANTTDFLSEVRKLNIRRNPELFN